MFKIVRLCKRLAQSSDAISPRNLQCTVNTQFANILPSNIRCFSVDVGDSEHGEENRLDMDKITCGDPDKEHKFKVIEMELEVLRQEGRDAPTADFIKTHHWLEIMQLGSMSARRKYYRFLFKNEMRKQNFTVKKEKRRLAREEMMSEPYVPEGPLRYHLGHNNMMLRIYDSAINNFYHSKLIQAMQFSQSIVVDCGYSENMTNRECMNCAKQMTLMFSENRIHDEPFDMHFHNADTNSVLIRSLARLIPTLYDEAFPFNMHQSSYLDHYPKDQLVYLTPHCRDELRSYDHDAVYIIGGIVDKINNEPLSLAKAKREGLRMAKLPLDKYLHWGAGSGKSLTLNHMISIMLDLRHSGNWDYALRHVPRRKLTDYSAGKHITEANTLRYDTEGRLGHRWKPSKLSDKGTLKKVDIKSVLKS